jgi:hypothetical protein
MACDPVSLQNAARCFTCVPDGLKPALNLSLLAKILGDTRDANTLESAASQFALLRGIGMQLAAKAYLLAVINGGSTDPKVLATQVAQYVGYVRDSDGQSNVESYLWALIAGGSTTPSDLIPAAIPYDRLRYDTWKVELYLLATKAGITSPQAVVTGASCFFSCLGGGLVRDVIIYLLCTIQNSGFFGSTFGLVTANAWAARVVTNGGAMPSAASIAAAASFVDTLNNSGVWSKLLDVNMFAPDSLTAALTPLLITDGLTFWQNLGGFLTTDLDVNGLQGSGTKYLNTGINLNPKYVGNPPPVFIGVSLYIFSGNDGSWCEWSWIQNNYSLYTGFTGTCFFDNFGTAAGRTSVANATWKGFISGSRTSFATSAIYKASSSVPFSQVALNNADNTNQNITNSVIFCFANNNGVGVPSQQSQRKMSFAAHHLGLSQADTQTLYNAVQALRVAFGGGFV